jgi:hypothetical protein
MEILFDTTVAAEWLTAHGVRRSPLTLRKLRCLGGGPRFRRLGNKPVYTESDLIAWIEDGLSEPMGSTSEADATMLAG